MCFSSRPSEAAPVVQTPDPVKRTTRRETSERVRQSAADERKRLASQQGDRSTIATSPLGLQGEENLGTSTLLS
jgi:hypothetical protein